MLGKCVVVIRGGSNWLWLGTIDVAGVSDHKPSGSPISAFVPQKYFGLESKFCLQFLPRRLKIPGKKNLQIGTMKDFRVDCNLLFWAFNRNSHVICID
jgi:hypothetical protein